MTRLMASMIAHVERVEYDPRLVLLAHCLADGDAARWARSRVDPAWMRAGSWADALRLAVDSAGLSETALLARFDGLTPDAWPEERAAIARDGQRLLVWGIWLEALHVPESVLEAYPVRRVAALARAAAVLPHAHAAHVLTPQAATQNTTPSGAAA